MAVAVREGCAWLVTTKMRHYQPGHRDITVVRPDEFVLRVRDLLARLEDEGEAKPDGE